jgi:hypothetical protein
LCDKTEEELANQKVFWRRLDEVLCTVTLRVTPSYYKGISLKGKVRAGAKMSGCRAWQILRSLIYGETMEDVDAKEDELMKLPEANTLEELDKQLDHVSIEREKLMVAGVTLKERDLQKMLRNLVPSEFKTVKESLQLRTKMSFDDNFEHVRNFVRNASIDKKHQKALQGNAGDLEEEYDAHEGHEEDYPEDDDEDANWTSTRDGGKGYNGGGKGHKGAGKGGGYKGKGKGRHGQPRQSRNDNRYGDGEYLAGIQHNKQQAKLLQDALDENERKEKVIQKFREEKAQRRERKANLAQANQVKHSDDDDDDESIEGDIAELDDSSSDESSVVGGAAECLQDDKMNDSTPNAEENYSFIVDGVRHEMSSLLATNHSMVGCLIESIAQVRMLGGPQTISDMFNVFEGLANGHADDSIAQSIVDTLKHEVDKRNHSTTDVGSSDQEIMSEKPKVTEVEAVDSMLSQSGVVAMHDRNNVPTGWASCMLVKGAHQVVKDVIGEAWCSKVCKAQDKIGDKWCADHQDVVMQDKVTMERTMKTPSAPMCNTKIRDNHRSIYARPNALNKVNAKPQDKEDEVTFGECMCNKIMTFMMMIPKLLMLPMAMVSFMLDQVGGLDKCIKNGPKVCLTLMLMFFVARGHERSMGAQGDIW